MKTINQNKRINNKLSKIIKTLLILFVTMLNFETLNAQVTEEWVQRYAETSFSDDTPSSIAADGIGNIYVTGRSYIGEWQGSYIVTIKYNSSGTELWKSKYGGFSDYITASSVGADGLGNVYVTGGYLDNNFADPNLVIIKYNSNGDSLWVKKYNVGQQNIARAMVVDISGNVYITGESYAGGIAYCLTMKYNTNGDSLWIKKYNTGSAGKSISLDGAGNVYVCGTKLNSPDYLLIKYNPSGIEEWTRTYNGPGNSTDYGHSIAVDLSGNVFVTGESYGSGSRFDCAIIKYNSSGVQQWVRRYNGSFNDDDRAFSIKVDNLGNTYIGGQTQSSAFNADFLLIKYNNDGDFIWDRKYNGPDNYHDYLSEVVLDASGNVYATGYCSNPSNARDYATIKFDSSGSQQWVKLYDGPGQLNDESNCIVVDESENVYVTGRSQNGFYYDYATIKYSQGSLPVLTLNLKAIVEGFYNIGTNEMAADNVKIYLRSITSPYNVVEFSEAGLNSSGEGTFDFNDALNGTPYYIVVTHRNAIETWSTSGEMFSSNSLNYDFTTAANKAFGNNLIQKGTKFCMFSGDPNQDGSVDGTDLSLIDNDASNFITGYVSTDLDGNDFVDASDAAIADNNAANFVSKITP